MSRFVAASAKIFISVLSFTCVATVAHGEEKPLKLPQKRVTAPAPAATDVDSPNVEILNMYASELYEIKKTEDAERDSVRLKESADGRQVQYRAQMIARKAKIELFKRRQEQIRTEIKLMDDEVVAYQKKSEKIEGEYGKAEQEHEDFQANLEAERQKLDSMKVKYETALEQLEERNERTKKSIALNLTQNLQLKMQLANTATAIESIETQVADAKADEMKAKAEWMSLKSQIEDQKGEKSKRLQAVTDAQKEYQKALAAQKAAVQEFAVVQKSFAEVSRKANEDVRRLEDATLNAQKSKMISNTNQMRAEAESDKIKGYVSMVKKAATEMIASEHDSQDLLRGAQLALETARSELSMGVAQADQTTFRREQRRAEVRSLASVEQSEAIMPEGKSFVLKMSCQAHQRARSASPAAGTEFTAGYRLAASPGPGKWVTTQVEGHEAYVKSECGSFE